MAIKLSVKESKWHGCWYLVIEPCIESWDIVERTNTWAAINSWCRETYGPVGDVWSNQSERWYANGGKYYFRNPADLTAFMLRWSQ